MIKNVVITGTGIMGAGAAHLCARCGFRVFLYGRSESSLKKGGERLFAIRKGQEDSGALDKRESEELTARIELTTSLDCFDQADIVSENIVEDLESKREFFRLIEPRLKKGAVLTTNTSGLSVNAIAGALKEKARFAGMHWINPPYLIPLVEIIRADESSEATIHTVEVFLKSLGKHPILVKKDTPGFVLNRLQFALLREALHLVEKGIASPEDVDAVFTQALGLRYACSGPFASIDLGGVDTFSAISAYLFSRLDNSTEGSKFLADLAAAGRYGVKSGAGVYDYPGEKAARAVRERDEKLLKLLALLSGNGEDSPGQENV